MASTSHPLSTATALDILQKGGNALDAATAAVAVQCVVEPQSTSIGGDCFCLYAPADSNDVIAINGSGRAPAGLDASMLREQGLTSIPQQSAHSVTVPTAVDTWVTLNRDHGSMGLVDILAPAIGYARDGYAITPRVAFDFSGCFDLLQGDANA
ncbi:MAG: gamma-glutamyltransferase, partial [Candidatus Puniceispirillaceae bacterium]